MGNKEDILSIATRLFAAKGYDVVGIQEISWHNQHLHCLFSEWLR
jgi:hypothetical protein